MDDGGSVRSRYGQLEDFSRQLSIFMDRNSRAGDGELESPWSAGAGVHIENAFVLADFGFVAVAVDYGGEARGCRVEIELMDVVKHVEVMAG